MVIHNIVHNLFSQHQEFHIPLTCPMLRHTWHSQAFTPLHQESLNANETIAKYRDNEQHANDHMQFHLEYNLINSQTSYPNHLFYFKLLHYLH